VLHAQEPVQTFVITSYPLLVQDAVLYGVAGAVVTEQAPLQLYVPEVVWLQAFAGEAHARPFRGEQVGLFPPPPSPLAGLLPHGSDLPFTL